ncbi:hypothetical protein ABBQ38_000926 [Trebouxia sp. C0009 RCD-2024]
MDVDSMKLHHLKSELKARRQTLVGNKAELQTRLLAARQAQGDLKSWIKQNDEEEWWSKISQDEPSALGAADQRIYKMFRLEQRRQGMHGDQKRLYDLVDEEEQSVHPLSPAASAEHQAIAAFAESGDFDLPELQEVIARYQAGDRSKVVRSARKASAASQAGGQGNQVAAAQAAGSDWDQSSQQQAAEQADPQDLSSYKASELKQELARLSLPTYGSRQQLEDRLMEHYQTAMQEDDEYEALAQQVENMSTTELQQQLLERGVDYQGLNKFQLQDNLWRYIQVEAGLLPAEDTGVLEDDLGEQLQFSTPDPDPQPSPKVQDPPTMVALLCGGPLHSQQPSLTSAQMVLQQLQTHNPREGFQGNDSSSTAASNGSTGGLPAGGSETSGQGSSETSSHSDSRLLGVPLQRRTDLTGIHFVPYFMTADLQAMPITLAELHGKPAATLQFEAEQQQRELVSMEELSQQLKAAADVAMSTVQGTAGAVLGSYLEEAGVPYVGAPAEAANTVANKYRCQRRLWELGFPVLPVCQLHWSNFAQPDPNAEQEGTEQEGAEQEGAEALSGGSEREGTSEHEGISEQEGSSAQEGVVEQQGSSRQQKGFFDQEGASDQEGVSEQQGASEQQDASEQQESPPHWRALLGDWMEAHDLTMDSDCFVIKPADESQGAGVLLVNDFESLELHAWHIFQQGWGESVVVEPYQAAAECTEFSVTVLGSSKGPVALLPMETEVFDYADDIFEADLEHEAYRARREGFDQRMIDVYLDAFRSEVRVEGAGGLGQVLISPFTSQQPASSHVRYHMPPRFSKEVVRGIRHAAAKAFQELGLQDIARIDGWVKVDRPSPPLPFDDDDDETPESETPQSDDETPESDSAELPASEQPIFHSSGLVTYNHDSAADQMPQEVERLPDDVLDYNSAPIALRAVPILPIDQPAEDVDELEDLSSEYAEADPAEAEATSESEDVASISTDTEDEDDESSLLMADVSPQELHGTSTIYLSGVHASPVLEPTSIVFQQAADVGMSHCALLRHVLSRACVRAGLPPIPPPIVQDVTETNLVPYVQLQQEGPAIDMNGATLRTAGAVYARPGLLLQPTPLGRIETTVEPKLQTHDPEDNQGLGVTGPMGGQFGQQWDEQQYPPMQPAYNYGNPDVLSQDYASDGYAEEYMEEEEEKALTKVWILMGGDGLQRQNSIKSGLHAWLMLQNNPALQVEPFLLAPQGANLRERGRRKELLRQRRVHLNLGVLEEDLPVQLQLSYIKNPPPPARGIPHRLVWAVPHSLLLRSKAEDIQAACELAHQPTTVVDRLLHDFERDGATLRRDVQRELDYGQVEGPGLLWGSHPMEQPPTPRLMDLPSFAAEARQEEAVLLNCVQSELGDNGDLQSYLQQKEVEVLHTGSDVHATALCHDKIAMSEHLKTLEVYHISTIPKLRLPLDVLFAASLDRSDAENLFQHLRTQLRDTPELCIKPAMGSWGLHQPLPCIADGTDLMLYGLALQDRWPSLPANALSIPHPEIDLPPAGNQQLMVEPYIHVARLVAVPQEQGPPQIQWEGDSRWIAISAALLGEVGQMQVLTPSILIHHPVPEEDELDGIPAPTPPGLTGLAQPIVMTPPPTEFLPADIIAAAKQWMTMAADRLAIAGAAHMDAFVHADKGEIIIIDVHTVPDLSPESHLLQQALVEQPPVHPNDVLREIVELAQLPMSEAPYEDDFAQLENQAAVDEDPDLVDLDGTSEAETYGGQSFQQGGRPEMGGSGGAAWSDDSFTDAALEDDAFDTSGFDVVDQ